VVRRLLPISQVACLNLSSVGSAGRSVAVPFIVVAAVDRFRPPDALPEFPGQLKSFGVDEPSQHTHEKLRGWLLC